MGLDNSTLFVANIGILLVTAAAYAGVWQRVSLERHWIYWIFSNLVLAGALIIYVGLPNLPSHLAVWPDTMLLTGFALRLAAARSFGGRVTAASVLWIPVTAYVLIALLSGSPGLNYALVNFLLALQTLTIAYEFWRDRQDRLPSRYGLVAVYLLMMMSFAFRGLQGIFVGDQIESYIPFDIVLEIHLLVALVHTAAGGVFVLSLAHERGAVALRQVALIDSLTGLQNRRAFDNKLHQVLEQGADSDFAIALLDIDHFKRVNDRHGHAAGDAVLKAFATICAATMRTSDYLYRVGGEEFALIISAVTPKEAHDVVERIRRAVYAHVANHNGCAIKVTVSAGICHSRAMAHDFDELLAAADAQLYRAKKIGRNRTVQAPIRSRARGIETTGSGRRSLVALPRSLG